MARYRKRPVVIDAWRYVGPTVDQQPTSYHARAQDLLDLGCPIEPTGHWGDGDDWDLFVVTAEGKMVAHVGDWIIRGVAGEWYPCKPEIFEATYEDALEEASR